MNGLLPIGRLWPARWLKGAPFIRRIGQAASRFLARYPGLRPRLQLMRALYFRGLGLNYFAAFTSLRPQVLGLFGSRGILPIAEYLARIGRAPHLGKYRYWLVPTIFWRNCSDRALVAACQVGQALSLLLMWGIAPRAVTALLFALYLSFVSVGRDFLSYQWDALLLEASFDSLFAAPPGLRSRLGKDEDPPWLVAQLLRFLFFRLHFESGLCKLQSGDPNWREYTACSYHYETQPLPTPIGWYAHHLPPKLQTLCTRLALGTELVVPWLLYFPRQIRRSAFASLLALQGLIALTGNYGFFNLLTAALGLWACDDAMLAKALPSSADAKRPSPGRALITNGLALPLLFFSVLQLLSRFTRTWGFVDRVDQLPAIGRTRSELQALRALNSYGLFAVMTTTRPEIIIEGSNDGVEWKPYEFRYKPGDPKGRPRFVAPHQPRLDWQMWFAAMQAPPPWFLNFAERLLQGTPEVLRLLKSNPFPEYPPRYIRASYYDYRFASLQEYRDHGRWWDRRRLGLYLPMITLERSILASA